MCSIVIIIFISFHCKYVKYINIYASHIFYARIYLKGLFFKRYLSCVRYLRLPSILSCSVLITTPTSSTYLYQFIPFNPQLFNLQVESILLSIISMLSSPNDESPANIDAAVSNWFCWLVQFLLYLVMQPTIH